MCVFCRSYIQPQWVFDCVNIKRSLPVDEYSPGSILPPHLSPFVEEQEGDYVPPERTVQLAEEEKQDSEDEEQLNMETGVYYQECM